MNNINQPYQGKYLLSDVDGTLMGHDEIISERNLDAIRGFCAGGGRFALATGRSIRSGRWIAQQVGANAPCILFNGAVVYDFAADRPLFVSRLPLPLIPHIKQVLKGLQSCFRIVIATLYDSFEVGVIADPATQKLHCLDAIPEDWIKVIFHVRPEEHDSLVEHLVRQISEEAAVVSSSSTYVEILPRAVSKGTALLKLAEVLGIDLKDIYVIGDYYNDREMLEVAHNSACPANAPSDIQAICQRVVCPVEQGAVAAYIEAL